VDELKSENQNLFRSGRSLMLYVISVWHATMRGW